MNDKERVVLLSFLPGLDALGAHVDLFLDAVLHDAHSLNIGVPAALRMAHGVADIITELWPLAADFTPGH
jgi:hypothetical protein